MSSDFLKDKEDDKNIEIEYDALVNLDKKDFSKVIEEDKKEIVFYCKKCKKYIDVTKETVDKKITLSCDACKGNDLFYGTKEGLSSYFYI
jgi:ribosomal protein L33